VPCCLGLVQIARAALQRAGKAIPATHINVGIQGDILDQGSEIAPFSSSGGRVNETGARLIG
jgi:hypothetical protein